MLSPSAKRTQEDELTHNEMQRWLRDLGHALGFDVHVAANDRGRPCADGRLGDGCLPALPADVASAPGADAVRLIDVLWIERPTGRVAAGFEVEHSTSIYSGIVRLLDLAMGGGAEVAPDLFLVAPDDREEEVRAQLARPAFQHVTTLRLRYLAYGDLEQQRHAMARFGSGLKPVHQIARVLT